MANIVTTTVNYFLDSIAQRITHHIYLQDALGQDYAILHSYYSGNHRPQLKREMGKQDDNVIENFTGLVVDRSVSRLFQGGVQFVLPDNATAQQEWLDSVWDLNKKEIILYQAGLYGATDGTWYFKIIWDDVVDPYTQETYPRLLPLNPRTVRIKTDPEDMNDVEEYKIEYSCVEKRGDTEVTVLHREITHVAQPEQYDIGNGEVMQTKETWVVDTYKQVGSLPIQLLSSIPWEYDFPPIIHCKNLPSLEGCYGDSEIDDVVNIQDKNNFVTSNSGKIIKFHASPTTIVTGVNASEVKPVDGAPNMMYAIANKDAKVSNLELTSDLASSRNIANDLRKSIFDISREPDITSLEGQLGALTNFGLHVLYTDAINKNDTKRQLYGDALLELNRRLLVLNNWVGEASRPGTITWGDPMPINILDELQADNVALDLGIVDKKTVAERKVYNARYGVDWETIQANIADEQAAVNANSANIGAQILKNFGQGQGTTPALGDAATTNPQPTPITTDTNPAKTAFKAPKQKSIL